MRRGIATVCLSGTLPDELRAAAAGFSGVEVFEADLVTSPFLVCSSMSPDSADDDDLGSRLSYELVQRTGAYDGYGATDAPVRMASQGAGAGRAAA